ncbi:MAG: histidinol-phosphate transaminase [Gammaproteobacteria bacterium]|nr:histidinol-phosphate transaminase [Gammaproteobacteria bacterium]
MNTFSSFVRKDILDLQAYSTAHPTKGILLHAMENPYDWPIDLKTALLTELSTLSLNRYPDGEADLLKTELRQSLGLPNHLDILLGNGSDECLQILFLTFQNSERGLFTIEPTFVMYKTIATVVGLPYHSEPLDPNFTLDREKCLATIRKVQPALIVLSYPNNPTASCFSEADIRLLLEAAPGMVVLDEAYYPFSQKTFITELEQFPNLLILRSFSKMGLAGLRLGYAVGNSKIIALLNKVRLPYNLNAITQSIARFAIRHEDVFKAQVGKIVQNREVLYQALQALPGLTVWPSEANFIVLRTPAGRALTIFESLKKNNIFIKCLDGTHPLLQDVLRVSVGTEIENHRFLEILKTLL